MFFLLLALPAFAGNPAAQGPMAGCIPGKVGNFSAKYRSFRSGYFPDDSEMEGGFVDRQEKPLRTLQSYLRGKAAYVSLAMDHRERSIPYGTIVRIPEVELVFNRCIEFRVVDTGGRFKGRGTSKVDICNDNEFHAESDFSNGWTDIFVVGQKR